MKTFNKLNFEQQFEAMQLIINIQMMQEKVHNRHFEFSEFANNSIDELEKLQEIAIKEYNNHISKSK